MTAIGKIATRLERQSHLMSMMMDRLGVKQELAAKEQFGQSMARAVRCCIFCRQSDLCEAWLSECNGQPAAGPEFCDNRHFFGNHS